MMTPVAVQRAKDIAETVTVDKKAYAFLVASPNGTIDFTFEGDASDIYLFAGMLTQIAAQQAPVSIKPKDPVKLTPV